MNLQKKKTVRLTGKALGRLRIQTHNRADGKCEACGRVTPVDVGHLSHVRSRGAGGADTLDNTEWNCSECHGGEHTMGRFTFCQKKRNKPRINIEICRRCQYLTYCFEGGLPDDQLTTDDMD